MPGLRWVQLTEDERTELLETGGVGVLSFGTDAGEPPASLPVSYGYLTERGHFYFNLSFPPGTEKSSYIDEPVSFVVFDQVEGRWQSVVATGTLEPLSEFPHESAAVQGMWAIDIPTVDIFDQPRSDVSFQAFRLVPETISGRKEIE